MSYTIEQLDCVVRTATERLRKDLASAEEQLRDQTARWGAVVDERDRLRDVLERLVDYQNGCPLPSYEKEWTLAMNDAAVLLGRSAPIG